MTAEPPRPLHVAYLTNLYPAASHTFIRREIAGVEARGATVSRFSIRAPEPASLVDEKDREEAARTTFLLAGGFLSLLGATFLVSLGRPIRFLRALAAAGRMGRRSPRGRLRHLGYLAEACVMARRLHRLGADHLHAHFGTNPAAVALLCRILGGPPYSFTVHGRELVDAPECLSFADKVRGAAFAVAVCAFGRGQLMRWVPPDLWEKLHVVRCGVDDRFLRDDTAPIETRGKLVCVGRLSPEKGQVLLLEAMKRLLKEGRDLEIVFVGDGPIRPQLEASIRRLELEGRAVLRGWQDGNRILREIEGAAGLVLPSLVEGLPVVIMEALALGRPVIGTAVGGVSELVVPGTSGWIVPAGSVDALANAIRELLESSPERLTEMGRAGARAVAERHDARREAGRLHDLFADAGRTVTPK